MSTENQRYADQLTLRTYSSRLNRPRIKPRELPSLRDQGDTTFDPNCLGFCVSRYYISTLMCWSSFLSDDGKCVTTTVKGTYEEIEETRCMSRASVDNFQHAFEDPLHDLIDDGPYIITDTEWSIGSNGQECMDSSYSSVSVVGRCTRDGCIDGTSRPRQEYPSFTPDAPCISSKTHSYERSFTTCANVPNRRLSGNRKPQLDFPALLPDSLEYRVGGYRTAWITSQVIADIVNRGGYKVRLDSSCKCVEGSPRIIGSVVGNILPPEETGLSGRSVTNLGDPSSESPAAPTDNISSTRSTESSVRNTSTGSRNTSSGSSSTPPSSGSSSTSSGSGY